MIAALKLSLWVLTAILIAVSVFIQRRRLSQPGAVTQGYRTLNDWWANLWTLFLLNGLVVGLLIYLILGEKNSAGRYAAAMLLAHPGSDSWLIMASAVDQLRTAPDVPLYSKLFFEEHIKFQYPMSSLVPLDWLQRLTGSSWETVYSLCDALSWLCVLLTGVIAWRLFVESYRVTTGVQAGYESKRAALIGVASAVAVTVAFYPLAKSYSLGQIQTTMTLFAALALLLWQRERTAAAGILLGLCCAIKPQWGALIVWGVLRRQWNMVIASTVTLLAITLIAIQMYGLRHYIDYLPVLSFLSMHGEAYYPNQSVNGLMNRLLFNGSSLHFDLHGFPPYNRAVYVCTLLSGLLIVGTALLYKMKQKPTAIDLALMMLSLTIASPIAWEHHYGILLPIFALLAPIWLSNRPVSKPVLVYLLLAFFLTSQFLPFINLLADTRLNIFQSYLLFGAVMVLLMLYRTRYLMPASWGHGKASPSHVPIHDRSSIDNLLR